MVARADGYHIFSPGSPIPISFGMDKDPSQSMSLNPGAGSAGNFGSASYGGSGPVAQTGSPGGVPASWQPSNPGLSVTNLAPVHVSAATLGGAPMFGNMYSGMGGNGGMGGSLAPGGVHVKDLAPVHVTAQTPRQPGFFGSYMQWANDHPMLSKLAETTIPTLSPVFAVAHAYYNSQHGKPLLGSALGDFGDMLGGVFGKLGNAPGGPLSSNGADMYSKVLDGSGSGAIGGGTGGVGGADSVLPNYPGLASVSAYPLSGDMGGYWNQQAIHDAAPTYGPFAGF